MSVVYALVEIPSGSKVKYERCEKTGRLLVDRILFSSVHYPHNYGLIDNTLADDGDPVDVLIMSQVAFYPLSMTRVRPIGILRMVDEGEVDHKLIAVCVDDPDFRDFTEISELPHHRLVEIRTFFSDYKKNEGKTVRVGEFEDSVAAEAYLKKCYEQYQRAHQY